MKGPAISMMALISVAAVVVGVAWFRSARPNATPAAGPSEAAGAVAAASMQDKPAQTRDVGPDPPPAATRPDRVRTTAPASEPTSAPGATKRPRVVDLGADKCKACKDLAPILAELKTEYAGRVTVEFIDVWKNPKAGEPYKISVIPTQVFFDENGQEVWRHVGFLSKADFVAKFKELGVK